MTAPQFVQQVFTGAIRFAGLVLESVLTRGIAQHVITAGYRAAVFAAWENSALYPHASGARRCVLAITGNDANRNPAAVACRGITACEDLLAQAGLDVFVVCAQDIGVVQAHLGRLVGGEWSGRYDCDDKSMRIQWLQPAPFKIEWYRLPFKKFIEPFESLRKSCAAVRVSQKV